MDGLGFSNWGGYVFICGEDTTQGWKPNGKPSDSSMEMLEIHVEPADPCRKRFKIPW